MEQNAPTQPAGTVIQVMQPGYELMGRIVRPAMVIVADRASGAAAAPPPIASDEPAPGAYGEAEAASGATVDTKA